MSCFQSLCALSLVFVLKGVAAGDEHVRLVDASGALSHAGLLQVQSGESSFGTVCGMNLAAVDVVCRQLGFDYGSLASSACGSYGGANICGVAGSPVSMQDLACTGSELAVDECTWSAADATCSEHAFDSVVYCGTSGTARQEGGLVRLLSSDGAPSLTGVGLLEVNVDGAWSPVCGLSPGATSVACKMMGFAGAASSGDMLLPVTTSKMPQVGNMDCAGSESNLLDCSYEAGTDVFCAPSEATVVQCSGEGDSSGRAGRQ